MYCWPVAFIRAKYYDTLIIKYNNVKWIIEQQYIIVMNMSKPNMYKLRRNRLDFICCEITIEWIKEENIIYYFAIKIFSMIIVSNVQLF